MNIVTINVNGVEYKLKGEESKEYLNSIAKEVDDKIKEMMALKMDKLEPTVSSGLFLLVRLNLFLDEIGKHLKYILK